MKSVGAVGVLGGYAGTAGASVQECSCEELGGGSSACFTTSDDDPCEYCKIDDSVLGVGQTCTVPGTSITVTRVDSSCISWTDSAGEVEDIALKAGSGDGQCTYLSAAVDGKLCTQDGKDISHITVKHSCDGGNGGPTPTGETLNCTLAEVDVTGLDPNEEVTLTVSFHDCSDYSESFTADGAGAVTASIDLTSVGRCYCTPTSMTLTGTSSGTIVDGYTSDLPTGFCEPTVEASGTCSTVTAKVTDGFITGCPIKATLSFVEDDCGTKEHTFNSAGSYDFDVPCYCTPKEVVFTYDGGSQTVDVAPSDGPCGVTLTRVAADCKTVRVTGTGVPGCPVTVKVAADCDITPKTVNANDSGTWSVTFDVPCYCTPTGVRVYKGSRATGTPVASQRVTVSNCGITANRPVVDCQTVKISGTGVPGCPVTVAATFDACKLTSTTVRTNDSGAWSATLTVPCYCTPEKILVYEGDRVTDSPAAYSFDAPGDLDCKPDFDATFYCDAVDVKATGLRADCRPVTATVTTKADPEGTGISPTCNGTYTVELTAASPAKTIDLSGLPCGCEPEKVVFSFGDRFLGELTAGDLNCICDTYRDVCKFEWYDDDQNEILFNKWLSCNGGQVKFTNPTYKDGNELVCFDFESTFPVTEVFVKGGGGKDAGNTYTWPCGTTDSNTAPSKSVGPNGSITWTGSLCSNLHPNNGKQTAVSHVTFRVCDEDLDTRPTNG